MNADEIPLNFNMPRNTTMVVEIGAQSVHVRTRGIAMLSVMGYGWNCQCCFFKKMYPRGRFPNGTHVHVQQKDSWSWNWWWAELQQCKDGGQVPLFCREAKSRNREWTCFANEFWRHTIRFPGALKSEALRDWNLRHAGQYRGPSVVEPRGWEHSKWHGRTYTFRMDVEKERGNRNKVKARNGAQCEHVLLSLEESIPQVQSFYY